MFYVLFSLSVAVGAVLFIRLLGPDAWLVKGLREDKVSAVVVTCFVVVCAVLLIISLVFLLRIIPSLWAPAIAAADNDMQTEHLHESLVWNVVHWFLSLCIPILSGYLLYLLYSMVYRVLHHFSPNHLQRPHGYRQLASRH